jgi:thiamine pyrophosphate-dependent acetolactate synthase large subunit-like protein
VFTPGGFAGMGFGTCGVLALKLAEPDRPCVCVTSDGSFGMFPHAVATAVEYDLPCIWVLMNNCSIGVIRDLQRFYMDGREVGTSFRLQKTGELWSPDWAKMAEAMGAARTVEKPGISAASTPPSGAGVLVVRSIATRPCHSSGHGSSRQSSRRSPPSASGC